MMKTITTAFVLLMTLCTFGQTAYETQMLKGLEQWQNGESLNAIATFERIAQVESNNWLPLYYVAHVNIVESFSKEHKKEYKPLLEKAAMALEEAMLIDPDNPELEVLEAMRMTSWVSHNGMLYGVLYSGKISGIYERLLATYPDNPRVVLQKGRWDMGTAEFFGKDTSGYCLEIEKALVLAEQEPKDGFLPRWGYRQAKEILEAKCGL